MPQFNRVIIAGHLTRDPQLKYLPNQTPICEGGIAVSRRYKTSDGQEKEDVCFVDWSCFGKGGEVLAQYMKKGAPILLEGRLRFDSWEDKNGGGKRSKLSMVVENFQFLGGKRDDDDQRQESQRPYPETRQSLANKSAPAEQPFPEENQFQEADIPF